MVNGLSKSSPTVRLAKRPASDYLETAVVDAPRYSIGELHVMNPVSKSRVRYFAFTPDGSNEI